MIDWIMEIDWFEFFQTYAVLWVLVLLAYPFIKGYYRLAAWMQGDVDEDEDD